MGIISEKHERTFICTICGRYKTIDISEINNARNVIPENWIVFTCDPREVYHRMNLHELHEPRVLCDFCLRQICLQLAQPPIQATYYFGHRFRGE